MAMKSALKAISVIFMALSAYVPNAAHAVVPGSKVTVTFEGLAMGRQIRGIPNGYDGCNWGGGLEAAAKGAFKTDPGFQAVIRKHVAAVIEQLGLGVITPNNGLMSIKSGHFAAFANSGFGVTFNAYRNNVLVGTLAVPDLGTADTFIQFDKTFSNIDRLEIDGQVALDNLLFKFAQDGNSDGNSGSE